jgi:urea transport system permease protein
MSPHAFSEALFNGLSFSSILILTALGLAITFGVMRVINMAHGDMLMLGAYTAYVVTNKQAIPIMVRNLGRVCDGLIHFVTGFFTRGDAGVNYCDWSTDFGLEMSFFWAIPISFLVVGAVGYVLEVGLIRFLYGRPTDTLLATWGVSLVVQQLVLYLFEADLKPSHMPEVLDHNFQVAGVTVPVPRLFVLGVTILCLLGVWFWLYRTRFGLQVRAVTQNRSMASAMGISTRWVDSLTFAVATGLAGVAGCICSLLFTVKYNMGLDYIVEAFMVVIMGGLGQLGGSVVAGGIIGTADSFIEKWLVNASMAKVIVLVGVIVFIMVRPSGIFTSKERSYE